MNPFFRRTLNVITLGTAVIASAITSNQAAATDLRDGVFGGFESLDVGAAIGIRPTYEGSSDYEAVGFPIIVPQFANPSGRRSKVSFRGLDDIRYRLIDWGGLEAGPLAGYDFGRDESDGALLQGLGDIDGGVVVGGFVGYRFDRVLLDLAYLQNVTSDADTGFELRLGAGTEFDLADSLEIKLGVGTTYASEDYVTTYFGITNTQAAASGLTAYDTEAGFKDVYLDIGLKSALTDHIILRAGAKYQHLIGDAADSPIVASESQFLGSVGLSYRFDFTER